MSDGSSWRRVAFRRRLLLVFLVATQTLTGLVLFAGNLSDQAGDWSTSLLLIVFGILFAWIGVGFWTAVFGFITLRSGGDSWSLSRSHSASPTTGEPIAPTAVVMPIFHEPVQRTIGGLRAVIRDLEQQGRADALDFYLLSDSRDPEIWLEEQAACEKLREELGSHHRLFYRRRRVNLNHKSGNIADFMRRWGRQYRYMVVMDADSLLSANCIIRLITLMESRPQAGIIQTTPRLARAESRFARLQQFANRCYGRLYSAGLASIQLGEAAYWGHNAIVRVAPFMAHCGLRKLQGPGLFSGPVLSHDFIEAALMGRAGYEVWLEPAISGSFEESPPTLEDDLTRDRRWCRGNLQHIWLLATLGKVRLAHRMALVTGILAYMASPLWLTFLGLSGYVAMAGPEATPALPGVLATTGVSSGNGLLLVATTALLLFGPRMLALADHALTRRAKSFGGMIRLIASAFCETLVALALAPIRMTAHTLYVIRAPFNPPLGWQGQTRAGSTDLGTSIRRFGLPMVSAMITLAMVHWQTPALTHWALPVALPVLLAPVLARWLNNRPASRLWLQVPEDKQPPPVIASAGAEASSRRQWESLTWVEQQVLSPAHARTGSSSPRVVSGKKRQRLHQLVERCAAYGQSALDHGEMSLICSHPPALEALHLRAWHADTGSPWRKALDRLARALEDHPEQGAAPATRQREEALWINAAS